MTSEEAAEDVPDDYFPLKIYHYLSNTKQVTESWSQAWHETRKFNLRTASLKKFGQLNT